MFSFLLGLVLGIIIGFISFVVLELSERRDPEIHRQVKRRLEENVK